MTKANQPSCAESKHLTPMERIFSVFAYMGIGAGVGALIGFLGKKRTDGYTFAQYALTAGGAFTGVMLSYYATKNDPKREKELDDTEYMQQAYPDMMRARGKGPKLEIVQASSQHEGVVRPEPVVTVQR